MCACISHAPTFYALFHISFLPLRFYRCVNVHVDERVSSPFLRLSAPALRYAVGVLRDSTAGNARGLRDSLLREWNNSGKLLEDSLLHRDPLHLFYEYDNECARPCSSVRSGGEGRSETLDFDFPPALRVRARAERRIYRPGINASYLEVRAFSSKASRSRLFSDYTVPLSPCGGE